MSTSEHSVLPQFSSQKQVLVRRNPRTIQFSSLVQPYVKDAENAYLMKNSMLFGLALGDIGRIIRKNNFLDPVSTPYLKLARIVRGDPCYFWEAAIANEWGLVMVGMTHNHKAKAEEVARQMLKHAPNKALRQRAQLFAPHPM